VPRKDLFLTSKLWNDRHSPSEVEPALDESLKRLGVDYLDLYLIHWPVAFKKGEFKDGKPVLDLELTNDPYPTWQALEKLVDKGKVRNIGISK
jgi:diketogulonate reductase-like aldo/keto reductase